MFAKKVKNKLLLILLSTILILPLTAYAYSNNVILGGENVGIEVKSSGVVVVGFYNVNGMSPGKEAGLSLGDVIIRVDDTDIHGISDLSEYFSDKETLKITYLRNKKEYNTTLNLKKDGDVYKTGLYIKDSIVGIGTLTFIDPESKRYGALGHEILEQNSGVKFEIKEGSIFKSDVTSIEKAEKGEVGEKNAVYDKEEIYGTIDKNDKTGIYGDYTSEISQNDLIETTTEVKTGAAKITTVIEDDKKEEFDINIISVDPSHNTKNILFEVTDKELLEKGNGIVQGMSGSPIIQNNKLIGAVTHVLVDDPHKGYGILIDNMLKESEES